MSDPGDARRYLAEYLEEIATDAEMDVLEFGPRFADLIGADPSPTRYSAGDIMSAIRNGSRPSPLPNAVNGLALIIDME